MQEAQSLQPQAAGADGAHSPASFPAGSSLPGHGDAARSRAWSRGSAVRMHLLLPDGLRRSHKAGDTLCTLQCPAQHVLPAGRALLRCWVKGAPVDGELLPRWGGLKQVLSGCLSVRPSVCLSAWRACPCCCFCTWAMQAGEVRCRGCDVQQPGSGTRETARGRGSEPWDGSRATKQGARGFQRPG